MAVLAQARKVVPGLMRREFSTVEVPSVPANAVLSGSEDGVGRKVQIFSPSRVASQQGTMNTGFYKLQFEATTKWENPLMGWTTTADVYANLADWNTGMQFQDLESAKRFCASNGWEVTKVREAKVMTKDHPATIKGKARGLPKAYSDNFSFKRRGIPGYDLERMQ